MTDNIELLVLSRLAEDEEFVRKALPYIKNEYFSNRSYATCFSLIETFFEKYNTIPDRAALNIELENGDYNESDYEDAKQLLNNIYEVNATPQLEWLLEKTEKFCQDRAVYNAIMESIKILDGDAKEGKGAIPEILTDALSVSFDTHIGHNFFADAEERYDLYHESVSRLPFHLDMLNKITGGGIPKKTLNVIMGSTGCGKTLVMCDFAANHLAIGKNVLYITLEMAEERIAERIDANLMNIQLDELKDLPKDSYLKKVDRIRKKTQGELVIKEYPTASVGAGHFRHLMNELKLKKNFVADVIYIDYLNLCLSQRMKMGGSINSYSFIKAIAEELRGLAVEQNVPLFSATQTNREGYNTSDIDLTNTSESIGLPQSCDCLLGIVSTEELEDEKKLMFKQLKNRYGDPSTYRKFLVGIDRSKMKLFDVAQDNNDIIPDATLPSSKPATTFEEWT